MKKEVVVLSLGGSLIIPDNINLKFLEKFKKIIKKNTKKYKFIIGCGGGSIARKYISALRITKADKKLQSLSGISATRMNARFMNYFFRINPEKGIPYRMRDIKKYIQKQDILFCGALRYKPEQTSDSTAADIAKRFNSKFINLTNVKGLYDKDPRKNKKAKLIKKISWKGFHKKAKALEFNPGQHFVLDQSASKIIMENRIKTYIVKEPKEIEDILKNKQFTGTLISG